MRSDLDGDYFLRYKDENLILDKLQINHDFNVETSFKVRFPFVSDDLRCFSLESFKHNGQFLIADKETCKCVFNQYVPFEKFMREATWAVIKLDEDDSEEDNPNQIFELEEAEWQAINI